MNKTLNQKQNLITHHVIFGLCFTASLFFLLWKAPFGLGGDDEAFYLTIPLRILQGDAFIVDEYHLSQLSGFLLYPLVALYKAFVPSLDGIILAFRYFYIAFHSVIALIIYKRIHKYGFFAIAAALLLYLYAPYNIMALSYNTMGLDFVALTGVLLATSNLGKSRFVYVISGLIFAGAVLCNPYLAAVYLIFSTFALIYGVKQDKRVLKAWRLFTLGVCALALIFIIFLLSRASFKEIFAALPALFADPDHPSISAVDKMYYYFSSTLESVPSMKVIAPLYCVSLILIILDKNREKRRTVHMIFPAVLVLAYLAECLPEAATNSYNFIMYPLVFCGMTAFLLTKKRNYPVFCFIYLLGFAYSVCMCFSSNQYFYVISMAATVSSMGSVILMAELFKEIKDDDKTEGIIYGVICIILIVCQLGIMCYSKANHMFWENHTPKEMTDEFTVGPAKGIRRTPDDVLVYERLLYDDIKPLKDKQGSVLYASRKTWYYLATPELRFGTFSAWLSGETPEAALRLAVYYKMNPEHIPDYVYIPLDAEWSDEDIEKILSAAEYVETETDYGWIYEKVK